uniref:CSON007110 protein n=1 Tax=Culicoides sonorensis TaxID=179676 RepID=A0A336LL77_CULSO
MKNMKVLEISQGGMEMIVMKNLNKSAWNMVAAQNPYDAPASPDSSTGSMSSLSSHSSYQSTQSSNNISINTTSTYYVGTPSPVLNDFKPFDLESWWGRRLFNNITKSL